MPTTQLVSVVVPLYNEEDNVRILIGAIREALVPLTNWELILVDDGSRDQTPEIAEEISRSDSRIRVARLARNYGQTQAMQAGFDLARGEIVVSMDGDMQNDPTDIPRLVEKLEEGYDLVAGYRLKRQDHFLRRKVPSWIANRIIRGITRVGIRDNGCSLKAYRRLTLDRMPLYSDMHRFLPALAVSMAGARITEVPVRHHARQFGQSKYGLSRIFKILTDLLTITLISWFRERPFVLFGLGALGSFLLGSGFGVASIFSLFNERTRVADAFVLPASMLLCFVLACFLLLLGLVAEVALRKSREEEGDVLPLAAERLL
ncbi:MAG: glycosyltransferase family 2 protein [Gemmatimonadota bacterium]